MNFEDRLRLSLEEKQGIEVKSDVFGLDRLQQTIDNILVHQAREADAVDIHESPFISDGPAICVKCGKTKFYRELKLSDFGVKLDDAFNMDRLIYYIQSRYEYVHLIETERYVEFSDLNDGKDDALQLPGLHVKFIYCEESIKSLHDRIQNVKDSVRYLNNDKLWRTVLYGSILIEAKSLDTDILKLVAHNQTYAYVFVYGNNIMVKADEEQPAITEYGLHGRVVEIPKELKKESSSTIFSDKLNSMLSEEIGKKLVDYYQSQGVKVAEFGAEKKKSWLGSEKVYKIKLSL